MEQSFDDQIQQDEYSGTLRIFPFLVTLLFLVFIGFVTYSSYSRWNLEQKMQSLDESVSDYQDKIASLQSSQVTNVAVAQQALITLHDERIRWSQLMKTFYSTLPEFAFYTSLSGNEAGDLNISVFTASYAEAADVVQRFVESPYFDNVFVKSFTQGISNLGETVVSFSVDGHYNKEGRKVSRNSQNNE